jgi:Salmonella virulence plasmid 65kDa B protein
MRQFARAEQRQGKGGDPMRENGVESESSEAAARASSPFDAPQISLPKGGGAIRGIDEKFTANPATGTGSLSIPLALSAGRSGFGPRLSLSYDSGQGNGPFGLGWSLSLPKIALRTDKGLPCYGRADERQSHYRRIEESDIFVLSGAEDLVPVLDKDKQGAVFVEFDRDSHRVRRYRPRIEGLFARIERWTCLETGVAHWRSISRDNVLTVYGLDGASRIADPADPTHVFSWLICRSYDDRGNAIMYDYATENDCGVDTGRPSECSRPHSANRYLKRVRYGNRVPLLFNPAESGTPVRCTSPDGESLSRRERPGIRAHQADLAAAAFPGRIPAAAHDGTLRDRDSGMDV